MTSKEFSDSFDTLLNSYAVASLYGEEASKSVITLDEYEKSLFLTQAQELIVKSYFYGGDSMGAFDGSEKRQVDFSSLKSSCTCRRIKEDSGIHPTGIILRPGNRNTVSIDDILFITHEQLTVGETIYMVKPIHYREYEREMSKGYGQPLKRQAWRIIHTKYLADNSLNLEVILRKEVYDKIKDLSIPNTGDADSPYINYFMQYIRKPKPIILAKFPNGLTIDGCGEPQDPVCELDSSLHYDILTKAVELAFATRGGAQGTHEKPKENNKED